MKKLMIAVALVCAAAMSQAASFAWTTTGKAYGPSATDLANLVDGKVYASGTATADYMKNISDLTWTAVVTLTSGGDTETIDVSSWVYSSNKIKASNIESTIFSGLGEDPKTIDWSIVITGTKANGDYITSDALVGSANYTQLSDLSISTAAPASWTATVAAPEPTSGMLLLLGFAGLALRRRRA